MAAAPVEARALVAVHAAPGFLEGWDGEGGGEDGGWARGRFLEELVLGADGAVLVAMAAALADVLVGEGGLAGAWCERGRDAVPISRATSR